jgi:hypothetical protein
MISFIQVIDVLRTFAQGHLQLHKFDFEFREQMPNLATVNEAYPMLYIVPVGTSNIQFGKEFDLDIYCVDRYKKDRSNVGYVISDTELILSDLSVYLENQTVFDSSYGSTTPINNDLLDYVGGHVMRIRVTVEKQALCELPFDSESPVPPTCPSALVRNSDGSWSEIVPSGATYILPDTPVTVLDSDGGVLFTTDVVSITGGNVTAPDATYLVEYENGTPIESGSILSGGSVTVQVPNPIVCEDATAELYFDGELIDSLTIPSGGTDSFSIDCSTPLNAVRVSSDEFSHQHTGTFVHAGELNGKPRYEKIGDPDREIIYDGTRWLLEKLGGGAHQHLAAIGNEDFPWLANWTDAYLNVNQATIGTYCANGDYAYYRLVDSDGNVLATGSIPSGDTADITAPDTALEINSVPTANFPAGSTIDFQLTDGTNPVTPDSVTVVGNVVTAQVPAGSTLDPDAEAFLTAASISDATITSAIDTLVKDLKDFDIWNKCRAIYPFVGGTATTHKFNLKDPRDADDALRLTFFGGITHSATGADPNGTTGYANTFIRASAVGIDDIHLSFYSRENTHTGVGNNTDIGHVTTVSNRCALSCGISNTNSPNSLFGNTITTSTGAADGFFVCNLQLVSINTVNSLYKNGVLLASNNTSKVTDVTSSLSLFRTGGAASSYANRECAFASIGFSLSATDVANFNTIVQTFNTALSRNV